MRFHQPVLLKEVIDGLFTNPDGIYIDCTLGHGGHAYALLKILSSRGKLIGIDQDINSINIAKDRLKKLENKKFLVEKNNFVNLKKIAQCLKLKSVSGILYDLGFSAEQIYNKDRGFSYHLNAPLDMRMNLQQKFNATDIINTFSKDELSKIFQNYGEKKYAHIIAKTIVKTRREKNISTTHELVEIIRKALPAFELRKKHPGRKIFQALRITVNNELEILYKSIVDGIDLLRIGGRMAIISYHSLEDKIVKNAFKEIKNIKILTKSPLNPTETEKKENRSSRSAKLRIIEKTNA